MFHIWKVNFKACWAQCTCINLSSREVEAGSGRCLWVLSQLGYKVRPFSKTRDKWHPTIATIKVCERNVTPYPVSAFTENIFCKVCLTLYHYLSPEECQLPFLSHFQCVPIVFKCGKTKLIWQEHVFQEQWCPFPAQKGGGTLTYLLNILSRANFLSPDVGINVNSQLTLLVSYSTLLF